MQTNKEFLDALDIRPEDGFLAVAVRRAAAWQLGKPVLELESDTVGEPDFLLGPWDHRFFLIRIEEELQCKLSINKAPFPGDDVISLDWFRGPAIKMPMGEWTKVAVGQFLGPIRDEILCPENWTPFEPQQVKKFPSETTFVDYLGFAFCGAVVLVPLLAVLLALPGLFFGNWANTISKPCVIVLVLWPWFVLFVIYCNDRINHFFGTKEIKFPEPSPPQLLGTLTFRENIIHLADDLESRYNVEIRPGDYRLFLVNESSVNSEIVARVVLTDLSSLKDVDIDEIELISRSGIDIFDLDCDSLIIGVMESSAFGGNWISVSSELVIHSLCIRNDGTVCGVKLNPTFCGIGKFPVYVKKTKRSCRVWIGLAAPDEET